jgi:6-phosphogluconolactonase/glucosamine-6-phosphate isomerase/deaminase
LRHSIHRFSDETTWIERILRDFEGALRMAIGRGQVVFHVSLAGGNTPEPVYRALAVAPSIAGLSAEILIHLWVGDERDVPAESPLRNGRMIASAFGEGTAAACWQRPPHLHFWPQGDRLDSCTVYAREMLAAMGERPVFDLVLLGLGVDGHTAGLFPPVAGETAPTLQVHLATLTRLTKLTTAPSEPKSRMTMSSDLLKSARRAMVLVRGREKQEILGMVSEGGAFPVNSAIAPSAVFYYLEQ